MSGSDQRRQTGPTAIIRGPFGLLWAGQSVSLLGDVMFLVAFTWQIAVQWQQPALLGVLLAARVLAELVALGFGGWIVDRLPRRNILLVADTTRALLLLGLAFALHQPPATGILAMLLALFGVATGLFRPALYAYIPEVVDQQRLPSANARLGLSAQGAALLGPPLGAALVAAGSVPTALRLDALSFAVAALAAVPLPVRAPAAATGGAFDQATEGFRVARRVSWIGGSILVMSLTNIATLSAERLALPRVAAERYGQVGGYGVILVAIAAGSIIAALAIDRFRPPRHPGRVAYIGVLLFAMAIASFGLGRGLVAAVAIGLVFGFAQMLVDLLWTTGLQQHVPDRLLGRINAVDHFGSYLFLPLSFAFGGLVVQAVSPGLVLVGAGVAAAVGAAVGLTVPALHRWRTVADDGSGVWLL